jgi:glutamate-ammonia-ligase adenylyltransferase
MSESSVLDEGIALFHRAIVEPADQLARQYWHAVCALSPGEKIEDHPDVVQDLFSVGAQAFSRACDPSTAVYAYVRLAENATGQTRSLLWPHSLGFDRLIAVLGASREMGLRMMTHPDLISAAAGNGYESHTWNLERRTEAMCTAGLVPNPVAAEGGDVLPDRTFPSTEAITGMRREYVRQLAAIMAWDLDSSPLEIQPDVSRMLSDVAQAAFEAAFRIAAMMTDSSECIRFCVIGMGKLGGRELNYVSDCDVIDVSNPVGDLSNERAEVIGAQLGQKIEKICQSMVPGVNEPPLWKVDTTLRPEGQDGPLARSFSSHRAYYSRWAENWEFQALLKARYVAGDLELGHQYEKMASSLVWSAAARPNFVFDCQKMRTRVEDNIPQSLREREIKLGKGGLRDVEFTVQILQMVHGRTDQSLRTRSTLGGLNALIAGGYVGKVQGTRLARDYRFERVLEHRQQMWQMRRTHLFPDLGDQGNGGMDRPRQVTAQQIGTNPDICRLARAFSILPEALISRFDETRREVRRLHEDIFYRPMLPRVAQLSDDDLSLTVPAARDRYTALGFADPDSAMRRVTELTRGLSRAAKINRIILPSMLQSLGNGQDPDMGILMLARIEQNFAEGSPYLGILRDSPFAADRLCAIVSNSRFLGTQIARSVSLVSWLADDDSLKARSRESLDGQFTLLESRCPDSIDDFSRHLLAARQLEMTRLALGWMCRVISSADVRRSISDLTDAVLSSALRWSLHHHRDLYEKTHQHIEIGIIALGRYGGQDANFNSDADMMIVDDVQPVTDEAGEDQSDNQSVSPSEYISTVIADWRRIVSGVPGSQGIRLDFDLRPEGKDGPLVRSLDSCRTYYSQWAQTWESQALLRARVAAESGSVASRFIEQIANPLRYPTDGLQAHQVEEIRQLKARMEAERLPRGVDRTHHLKLGYGGLSDVEWTVQLLQLEHAGTLPDLQTVSTLSALAAEQKAGFITPEDAIILRGAWEFESDVRNAAYLWRGTASDPDVITDDVRSLGAMCACMGFGARRGEWLENELMHRMRVCRTVVSRLFYGRPQQRV